MNRLRRFGLVLAAALSLIVAPHLGAASPTIAAASDLKFALDEIAGRFRAETGIALRISYGSSGNFYRQIRQGAPFEMFLSADETFVDKLASAGLTLDAGTLYAVGRLVLFAPKGSPLRVDPNGAGLRRALDQGQIQRFAIANPEHAPYGRAAEEFLRHLGIWEPIRSSLVLGENVSQAAQFALSGSAQGGVFAYSLALAPAATGRGVYVLIPAEWHAPLRQKMVLMKRAGASAQEFYRFMDQPATREILHRYGFTVPSDP